MKKLIFLIGASGAGKTTAAKSLEERLRRGALGDFVVYYFDRIGVPSEQERFVTTESACCLTTRSASFALA